MSEHLIPVAMEAADRISKAFSSAFDEHGECDIVKVILHYAEPPEGTPEAWLAADAALLATCVRMWASKEVARRDQESAEPKPPVANEWTDFPGKDGWYWCEELADDAPPQLLRREDHYGDDGQWWGASWNRWTVAGWVEIRGRVCKVNQRPVN